MSKKEKAIKSYHGHRERLRKRFQKTGFTGFHDYEVLELLLTYVLSRKDTKPTAKELLKKFKSFNGVLNASIIELQEVKGIKEKAALFLKILSEGIAYYFEEKARVGETRFTNLNELFDYAKATIGRKANEVMKVIYLNSRNVLIETENLSEGTVSEAVAFPRRIVEGALKSHATSVIIAHNHPDGIPEPSNNDNIVTQQVKEALRTVGISLQEHLIIAENGFYSYRQSGCLN